MTKKNWNFDQQKIAIQARRAWNRLEQAMHYPHHKEYHLYGARGLRFKGWTRDQFESWFRFHVIKNKIVDPAVTVIRPFDHVQPDNVLLDNKGIVVTYKARVEREVEHGLRRKEVRHGDIQLEFVDVPRVKIKVDNTVRAKTAWRNIRARCTKPHNKWFKNVGAKGIELKIDQKAFVEWFLEQQSKNEFAKPAVDRKNRNGHFELNNLKLMEMSEFMAKEGKVLKAVPVAIIPEVGKHVWCRSIADAARYLGVHPTTIRTALKNKKPVKGSFKVAIDPGPTGLVVAKKWSSAA